MQQQLTTQSILNQLPISSELRDKLLTRLETGDDDTKFYLEREIWDIYYSLEDMNIDAKIVENLEKVKAGKADISPDFYKQTVKEVDDQSKKEKFQAIDTTQIEEVRSRLQKLMN
ncbi:hypothetical protein COU87_04390 [Candidatus Roizmanbacteria bacterium CG10_big_fil_rev_8_21_14_0_10_39_12]|uniref:Uncharacterized protein n=1 Tax=Candidatus Roizmanbacteria bacterium CG10_big_fil_rev_8_21_14_0_10_39_12 TaxID=1974852 RepID=A0A2M8KNL7_9BACT|nr:MAG: hypothetical protein COU87_04390 [Candidatus Roizmanbacteria bacterium CG10_big_fil_rev_8_21_14_0_10_39_12]